MTGSDMIQEIEKIETKTGDVFILGRKPTLKGCAGAELKKIKTLGVHEPRGPGDTLYYMVLFEDGSLLRLYDPKHVWFGKPKPQGPIVLTPDKPSIII